MTTKKVVPPRTEDKKEVENYREQSAFHLNEVYARVLTAHADLSATCTTTEIVADYNTLLGEFRTAGLLAT